MEHGIDPAREKDVVGYIMPKERKPLIAHQMGNIVAAASDEIIEADDLVPIGKQTVTQVRAKESGGAGNKDAHDNLKIQNIVSNDRAPGLAAVRLPAKAAGRASRLMLRNYFQSILVIKPSPVI